jgi:hypothetical protein
MAGHLLSSVNPEAAAQLQRDGDAGIRPPLVTQTAPEQITDPKTPYVPKKPLPMVQPHEPEYTCDRVPEVGEIVRYHARPGQGRAGKIDFSAMVMHCDPKGRAELMVFFSADDMSEFEKVPYRTDTIQWPAWSFIQSADTIALAQRLSSALDIIERLNNRCEALETLLADDHAKRIEALEARKVDLSPITGRLDALEGKPPAEKSKKG